MRIEEAVGFMSMAYLHRVIDSFTGGQFDLQVLNYAGVLGSAGVAESDEAVRGIVGAAA